MHYKFIAIFFCFNLNQRYNLFNFYNWIKCRKKYFLVSLAILITASEKLLENNVEKLYIFHGKTFAICIWYESFIIVMPLYTGDTQMCLHIYDRRRTIEAFFDSTGLLHIFVGNVENFYRTVMYKIKFCCLALRSVNISSYLC